MADDWQPGDLALCVRMPGRARHRRVRPGAVFEVEAVEFSEGSRGLILIDAHSLHWSKAHRSRCFRKIRPHKADEEDRETIALLTRKREPAET